MSKLAARFKNAGYTKVNFVILTNSTKNAEHLRSSAVNISVKILNDETLQTNGPFDLFDLRSAYVFDNCGRLAYVIYHPWSAIQRPYVKASILSTMYDQPCGLCDVSAFFIVSSHVRQH